MTAMTDPVASTPIAVVASACLVCALSDLRSLRIPNRVTLPLLGLGLVFHAATGGLPGIRMALGGAGFGFAVLLLPYLIGWMGAGDVKLMSGIGAWLGQATTWEVLHAAIIFAGLYSLFILVSAGEVRQALVTRLSRSWRGDAVPVREALDRPEGHRRLIPFAPMIALGLAKSVLTF